MITFQKWCNSTLIFISFAIVGISSGPINLSVLPAAKITPKNAHLITLSDEKSGTMLFKALKRFL